MRGSDEWDSAGERTHSWGDDDPDPDWLKEIEDMERSKPFGFGKVDLGKSIEQESSHED
jgi:hypothetical protein